MNTPPMTTRDEQLSRKICDRFKLLANTDLIEIQMMVADHFKDQRAALSAAERALEYFEYEAEDDICPHCYNREEDGHDKGCVIGVALTLIRALK